MRSAPLLCFALFLVLSAHPQNVNPNHPTDVPTNRVPSGDAMLARAQNAQLQKDAIELSQLCAAVRADMTGLKQGLLPKDLPDRLKRIEKLSKRVREQLLR